jgi:hypothetical protein
MAEKIDIAKLDLDVQDLIKKATESKTALIALRAEQAELKKSGEDGSAQFVRNQAEIKNLTSVYNAQTAAISAQVSEGGKLQNQQLAISGAVDKLNQSEGEYRNNNKQLLALRKDLNVNDANYTKNLAAINTKIDQNNSFIKENVSAYEKQKIGIGAYSEGIKTAINDTGIFSGTLGALKNDTEKVISVVTSFAPVLDGLKNKWDESIEKLGLFKTSQEAAAVSSEIAATATASQAVATETLTVAEATATESTIALAASTETLNVVEGVAATETALLTGETVALASAQTASAGTAVAAAGGTTILSGALGILGVVMAALGIGLIIAAIVLIIAAFKTFTPVVDKVEQVLAGVGAAFKVVLNAIIALVTGAKSLGDVWSSLTGDMDEAYDAAVKLKKAQQDLEDAMALQEVATARNRAEINRLNIQAKDRTKTEEERLALLNKSAKLEEQDYNARKKNADETMRIALEQIRIDAELTDAEFAQLKKQGLNYKEYVEEKTNDVDELFDKLKEAQLKQIDLDNEYYANQEKLINKSNKLIEDAEKAKQDAIKASEKARADAEKAEQERQRIRQEALNAYAESLRLQLTLFKQSQGDKAKAVDEDIKMANEVYNQSVKIAQAEYDASKKTSNDKLKLQIAFNDAQKTLLDAQANAVLENADREIEAILANNQKKLDNNKFLNDEMVKQEKARLATIAEAERDYAQVKFDNGVITQQQLDAELSRISLENKAAQDELDLQRRDAENNRKALDLENQKVVNEENFIAQSEIEREQNELKRQQEVADAEKTGADVKLINDKYASFNKKIDQSVSDFKLQSRANLIEGLKGLFGQESKLGKAVALADIINSTVTNASKAFQQASLYASNPLTAGLAVNAALQGGVIITTGAMQAAKTVGAKFEKGGLQEVQGNRHFNGGTVFTGTDGTRFEAEQGELIGVMNRNAAAHFMAFNNAYPSDGPSASNYFATGGIVSREVSQPGLNIDELAAKMAVANASLPAPIVTVEAIAVQANKSVIVKESSIY